MTPQFFAALKRLGAAVLLAVFPVLIDFLANGDFTEFGQTGILGAFALARLLEGVYDGMRDARGQINPGDVTPNVPAPFDPNDPRLGINRR